MIKLQVGWLGILVGCLSLGLLTTVLFAMGSGERASTARAQLNPPEPATIEQPTLGEPPIFSEQPIAQASPTPEMTMPNSPLTVANTQFGFDLFSQLQQNPEQNVSISPASVSIALSMLYNGATGNTQQAMAKALNLEAISLPDLNQANADLAESLQTADPKVKLTIANSLWGRTGFVFKPEFLQRSQLFYQAKVSSLDFDSPDAPAQINQWVSENTAGKIPKIVDQIDSAQVLFLINAIYFNGTWTTAFDPAQTQPAPFYLPDGSTKQQPTMRQEGYYNYSETDQFQAVSLPYGGRRFSMYLFLPRPESNLAAFQQTLTAESWEAWLGQFSRQKGSIQLPKFKVEYETSLINALKALGMEVAFRDGQAEFADLSDQDVAVSEVKHKTFLEVNEAGTEAAAVTSIGIRATSIDPNQPFQMQIDRPFFYAIRDNQTGTILFMGSIVNPE